MVADFVIQITGEGAFAGATWRAEPPYGYDKYYTKRQAGQHSRKLYHSYIHAACEDLSAPIRTIKTGMEQQAGGKLERTGIVCIFGSSNGAAVALGLAKAIEREISVQYICLADLPMFASGRSPGIPDVGNCQTFPPDIRKEARSVISSRFVINPDDRPHILLTSDVAVKKKENYFQHNGNDFMPFTFRNGWYWGCRSLNGEVHGKIDNAGWNNKEFDAETIQLSDPISPWHAKAGQYHRRLDDHVKLHVWPGQVDTELANF